MNQPAAGEELVLANLLQEPLHRAGVLGQEAEHRGGLRVTTDEIDNSGGQHNISSEFLNFLEMQRNFFAVHF